MNSRELTPRWNIICHEPQHQLTFTESRSSAPGCVCLTCSLRPRITVHFVTSMTADVNSCRVYGVVRVSVRVGEIGQGMAVFSYLKKIHFFFTMIIILSIRNIILCLLFNTLCVNAFQMFCGDVILFSCLSH